MTLRKHFTSYLKRWCWPSLNYFSISTHSRSLSSEYPNYLTRSVVVITMLTKVHRHGVISREMYVLVPFVVASSSLSIFYINANLLELNISIALHIQFWLSTWTKIKSDHILYISLWNTHSSVNMFFYIVHYTAQPYILQCFIISVVKLIT